MFVIANGYKGQPCVPGGRSPHKVRNQEVRTSGGPSWRLATTVSDSRLSGRPTPCAGFTKETMEAQLHSTWAPQPIEDMKRVRV